MRGDEKGLDTVFGALILILVCLMASSALIAMEPSFGDGSQDIQDLERKYDCILSSTLDLKYIIGGVEFDRSMAVETYAIELLGPRNIPKPVDNDSVGISSIIDFYYGGFDGWRLSLNDSQLGSIELASRGRVDVDTGSTYILSRSLIDRGGGEASLDLIIFQ
jgi:hypothetical protein